MNEDDFATREAAHKAQAAAINAFSNDLYQRVAKPAANLFFSPYSIHCAMRMALAGAAGKTAAELAAALQISPGQKFDLNFDRDPDEAAYEVNIANALWAQAGYPFDDQFMIDVKREHGAALEEVDFAEPIEAATTINEWIKRKTRERISDMISPGDIHELTRLILTNAIYFKADWREKFDPEKTRPASFHLDDGSTVQVQMMRQKEDFWAIDAERFQAIRLFYEPFVLSMFIFIPRRPADMSWLETHGFTRDPASWRADMQLRNVDLHLPRFRIETGFPLAGTLSGMGIKSAFSPADADFSRMTTAEGLWLSEVIHRAYVDVDEEGTEAAGVTAVVLAGGAGREQYPPLTIKVDRPFLFAITAGSHFYNTETILFMGRMSSPLC